MAILRNIVVRIRGNTADLNNSLTKTQGIVGRFGAGVGKSFRAVGRAAKVLGLITIGALGAFAGSIAAGVKGLVEYEKELRPAIERSRIGAEALQLLAEAAERAGSEDGLEGIVDSSQELQLQLGEIAAAGKSRATPALEALGLVAAKLQAQEPEAAFRAVLEALQQIPNVADRAIAAEEIFGGTSEKLAGIVNLTTKEFAALEAEVAATTDIWSGETLDAAKEFDQELENLRTDLLRGTNAIVAGLVPALVSIAGWIRAEGLPAFNRFKDDALVPAEAYMTGTLIPAFQNLVAWLQENVPPAMEAVSAFVTGTLVPAFERVSAWITGTGVPAVQALILWLQENIPPAMTAVSAFITETLVPAFQAVSAWITETGVPAVQNLILWLQVNIPPAMAAVSAFITETLVPAFTAVSAWITETGVPAVQNLILWLQVNIPPAMMAVSAFITETLVPAFKAVSAWITETGVPAVENLILWLKVNVPPAMEAVSTFITETLVPAFKAVSAWITETGVPAVQALILWLQENIPPAMTAVSAFITETLVPAFEAVSTWITETGVPAIEKLVEWFKETLPPAMQVFTDWLDEFLFPAIEKIATTLTAVWNDLLPIVTQAVNDVIAFVTDNWSEIETLIKTPVDTAIEAIKTLLKVGQLLIEGILLAIQGDWTGVWEKVEGILDAFLEFFKTSLTNLLTAAETGFGLIDTAAGGAFTAIAAKPLGVIEDFIANITSLLDQGQAFIDAGKNFATNLSESIISTLSGLRDKINATIRDAISGISGIISGAVSGAISSARNSVTSFISGIGSGIPGLQEGGTIRRGGTVRVGERGPELVTLPRGASVTPNGQAGGSTFNISVSANTRSDARGIAREVRREIRQLKLEGVLA